MIYLLCLFACTERRTREKRSFHRNNGGEDGYTYARRPKRRRGDKLFANPYTSAGFVRSGKTPLDSRPRYANRAPVRAGNHTASMGVARESVDNMFIKIFIVYIRIRVYNVIASCIPARIQANRQLNNSLAPLRVSSSLLEAPKSAPKLRLKVEIECLQLANSTRAAKGRFRPFARANLHCGAPRGSADERTAR